MRYDQSLTSDQRGSVTNGIWLCQTHAKAIDDDETAYSADVLRAWKRHAEEEASALLGKPISAQSLDMNVQAILHRAEDGGLMVTATTNLPNGTKLWVELFDEKGGRALGTVKTVTNEGMIAAAGFTKNGQPHPHGWYRVEVLAYFNGPWQQSDAVLAIVGHEGEHLFGRFAEPVHPELDDSEKRLHATFDCIAPPLEVESNRTADDLNRGISIVQRAVLTVDGRTSALPVHEVVKYFMSSPGLREFEGWSAAPLANGAVAVAYSYWNGDAPAKSEWTVILDNDEVRYRNLYGKLMSWAPDY